MRKDFSSTNSTSAVHDYQSHTVIQGDKMEIIQDERYSTSSIIPHENDLDFHHISLQVHTSPSRVGKC